jgi:hypothetical protein
MTILPMQSLKPWSVRESSACKQGFTGTSSQQAHIGRAQELLAELKKQRDAIVKEQAAVARTIPKAKRR